MGEFLQRRTLPLSFLFKILLSLSFAKEKKYIGGTDVNGLKYMEASKW
jgi:hypothetical protein